MKPIRRSFFAGLFAVPLAAILISVNPSPASAGAGTASLAIDADTTDGCGTIQAATTINTGTATSVGICLLNASSTPASGFISSASIQVTYTAPLTAPNTAPNGTTDLDSNPNWNQAIGGSWDCSESVTPAPIASPSPATLNCVEAALADVAISGNVLLATLNFDTAVTLGTSTLAFGTTDLATGALGVSNPTCGQSGFVCTGASITVQAPPTNTPTSTATNTNTPTNTPTRTNTPTQTNTTTPTITPSPTPTRTPTPSPTPCTSGGTPVTCPTATNTSTTAKTHTPTSTRTSVPTSTATSLGSTTPSGGAPTQPGGGTGAGGSNPIKLPDTGTSGGSSGAASYMWFVLGILAAATLGAGMVAGARRTR